MMKAVAVAVSAVSLGLLACGGDDGPQGPQGPEGPPGIASRSDMYCKTNGQTIAVQPLQFDVTVSCDAPADFPVEGSCDQGGGIPPAMQLVINRPDPMWAERTPSPVDPNQLSPARWRCSWQGDPGPNPPVTMGQATICCIAIGPRPAAALVLGNSPESAW